MERRVVLKQLVFHEILLGTERQPAERVALEAHAGSPVEKSICIGNGRAVGSENWFTSSNTALVPPPRSSCPGKPSMLG